jgi:hypothetical protein
MTLGKQNNLNILTLWFGYLSQYKDVLNPSKKFVSHSILLLQQLNRENPLFNHCA